MKNLSKNLKKLLVLFALTGLFFAQAGAMDQDIGSMSVQYSGCNGYLHHPAPGQWPSPEFLKEEKRKEREQEAFDRGYSAYMKECGSRRGECGINRYWLYIFWLDFQAKLKNNQVSRSVSKISFFDYVQNRLRYEEEIRRNEEIRQQREEARRKEEEARRKEEEARRKKIKEIELRIEEIDYVPGKKITRKEFENCDYKFVCLFCGKTCNSYITLESHMRSRYGISKFLRSLNQLIDVGKSFAEAVYILSTQDQVYRPEKSLYNEFYKNGKYFCPCRSCSFSDKSYFSIKSHLQQHSKTFLEDLEDVMNKKGVAAKRAVRILEARGEIKLLRSRKKRRGGRKKKSFKLAEERDSEVVSYDDDEPQVEMGKRKRPKEKDPRKRRKTEE